MEKDGGDQNLLEEAMEFTYDREWKLEEDPDMEKVLRTFIRTKTRCDSCTAEHFLELRSALR